MSATAIRDEEFIEVSMNAVVIYEDCDSARKADALLQRASERADAATQWSVKPWRVDLLFWPHLAKEALRDAAEAHLVVLTVCGQTEFPPGLLNWLEDWAAHRQVQDAALAAFDGGSGDRLSIAATPALWEFAERHGLSLITGDVHPAEGGAVELWEDLREHEVTQVPRVEWS